MLSKSQARLFFLGGTVLFLLLFLFLTADTMNRVPEQTNSQNISDAVARGREIWNDNNCMDVIPFSGKGLIMHRN